MPVTVKIIPLPASSVLPIGSTSGLSHLVNIILYWMLAIANLLIFILILPFAMLLALLSGQGVEEAPGHQGEIVVQRILRAVLELGEASSPVRNVRVVPAVRLVRQLQPPTDTIRSTPNQVRAGEEERCALGARTPAAARS